MKNHLLLKVISLLEAAAVLFATALVITEVVLGYSGFKEINGKAKLTVGQCQQSYTNQNYAVGFGTHLQISFISSLVCVCCSMVTALFLCCVYLRRPLSEEREDTRIEELQQQHQEIQRYHPKNTEIIPLYILLSLAIISSYVCFNFYVQIPIQARGSACQINYQWQEVIPLAVLSLAILITSLIALILLMILAYRFNARMKILEGENGSESYRQQIDRIIRQIPDSERRIYQEARRNHSENQQNHQERMVREYSPSHRSEIKIQEVPHVQSIIYKAEPELMLQSVNANRPYLTAERE